MPPKGLSPKKKPVRRMPPEIFIEPPPRELPPPGSLERIHMTHPFMPAAAFPNIIGRNPFSPESTKARSSSLELTADNKFPLIIVDAETNEELSITRSTWSGNEGRIDLNRNNILKLGTDELTIGSKVKQRSSNSGLSFNFIAVFIHFPNFCNVLRIKPPQSSIIPINFSNQHHIELSPPSPCQ